MVVCHSRFGSLGVEDRSLFQQLVKWLCFGSYSDSIRLKLGLCP